MGSLPRTTTNSATQFWDFCASSWLQHTSRHAYPHDNIHDRSTGITTEPPSYVLWSLHGLARRQRPPERSLFNPRLGSMVEGSTTMAPSTRHIISSSKKRPTTIGPTMPSITRIQIANRLAWKEYTEIQIARTPRASSQPHTFSTLACSGMSRPTSTNQFGKDAPVGYTLVSIPVRDLKLIRTTTDAIVAQHTHNIWLALHVRYRALSQAPLVTRYRVDLASRTLTRLADVDYTAESLPTAVMTVIRRSSNGPKAPKSDASYGQERMRDVVDCETAWHSLHLANNLDRGRVIHAVRGHGVSSRYCPPLAMDLESFPPKNHKQCHCIPKHVRCTEIHSIY